MNIVRRETALADLADCALYIAEDNPEVADRFLDAFEEAAERLSQMPYIGAAQTVYNPALFGLRRWPIKGFDRHIILEDMVDIVRVLHASRDWEQVLEEQ